MRGSRPAVEEIAPGRFVVRDMRAAPLLRGEGDLSGQIFTLTTWRRAGLVARLRGASLAVLTLEDQIAALPAPPPPPASDRPGWRALGHPEERFSGFDLRLLEWQPIAVTERAGAPGVQSLDGRPLRRRRGRSRPEYYLGAVTRGGALELRASDERAALLCGYACAAAAGLAERELPPCGDGWEVPQIALPAPYRDLIGRLCAEGDPPHVRGAALEMLVAALARLGLRVSARRGDAPAAP